MWTAPVGKWFFWPVACDGRPFRRPFGARPCQHRGRLAKLAAKRLNGRLRFPAPVTESSNSDFYISAASRCARFIREAASRRRRLLQKLRRPGSAPRSRGNSPAGRNLVQDEPSIRPSTALRALEPLAHSARAGKPSTPARICAKRGARGSSATGGSPRRSRPRVPAGEAWWNGRRRAAGPAPSARQRRRVAHARSASRPSTSTWHKHLAKCAGVRAIALLILDGAGWPSSPQLIVPENIVVTSLPPCPPELNSVDLSTGLGHPGVSARHLSQPLRPCHRRGDPRRLPRCGSRCLDRPDRRIRGHRLNWNQRMGKGQNLGRLVSEDD